jgi:hypothetical protein
MRHPRPAQRLHDLERGKQLVVLDAFEDGEEFVSCFGDDGGVGAKVGEGEDVEVWFVGAVLVEGLDCCGGVFCGCVRAEDVDLQRGAFADYPRSFVEGGQVRYKEGCVDG